MSAREEATVTVEKWTGGVCPWCGNDAPYYGSVSIEGTTAVQEASCDVCDRSWHENYMLWDAILDEWPDEGGLDKDEVLSEEATRFLKPLLGPSCVYLVEFSSWSLDCPRTVGIYTTRELAREGIEQYARGYDALLRWETDEPECDVAFLEEGTMSGTFNVYEMAVNPGWTKKEE